MTTESVNPQSTADQLSALRHEYSRIQEQLNASRTAFILEKARRIKADLERERALTERRELEKRIWAAIDKLSKEVKS